MGPPSTTPIISSWHTGKDYERKGHRSTRSKRIPKAKRVCTYKDSKQKEDYEKRHNHNHLTFAQTTPPAKIMRRIDTPKPAKTSIDRGSLEMAK